jgi:hypothetical protein
MCGNFGLLMLAASVPANSVHKLDGGDMGDYPERKSLPAPDKMDASLHRSMNEVRACYYMLFIIVYVGVCWTHGSVC